jgi:hypothetical protein
MAVRAPIAIGNCDGFSVVSAAGLAGWVEELWLDDADVPAAFAVRLIDGRRGLLLAAGIDRVEPERRTIAVGADSRLLELEPPHLDPGGSLAASWRATGVALPLPEPPGLLQSRIASLHRPPVAAGSGPKRERHILELMAGMLAGLTLIACSLIGIDILVAYLATGSPPY